MADAICSATRVVFGTETVKCHLGEGHAELEHVAYLPKRRLEVRWPVGLEQGEGYRVQLAEERAQ